MGYCNQFRVFMGYDPSGAKSFWQGSFYTPGRPTKKKFIVCQQDSTPDSPLYSAEIHQTTSSIRAPSSYRYRCLVPVSDF